MTTQKGNRLFVHILDYQDKVLFLPLEDKKIKRAFTFADKQPVTYKQVKGGIVLQLNEVPTETDKVIELQLH